ncbi:carboxypeptidase-like regulatory domain-containing protein [Niabella ginsengisoli]|uniref:Carboxypeptidase-like regulatory domain-containing protein n=1 Tax=Niabella ginsengisoli TaxID=522298 RepID=A0ABS9SN50_9BACT|nr:carboxypeptidase-like regulatory domain-containing protein [Niabella ginsengisoli]MCH5599828.1 carboxypeptidase-like regulatory domain-containing protein [Niabella ginsengisoli]
MSGNFLYKGIQIFITMLLCHACLAQDSTVLSGIVYDKNGGKPLADVSVMIVNANNLALAGNKTNVEGKFSVANVPGSNKIVFSNMGYQTQELQISSKTFSRSIL